jgi:cytochrome oxidase assembly protein ShyY1
MSRIDLHFLENLLDVARGLVSAEEDKPDDKVTITREEHRQIVGRIVDSFARDSRAWISERDKAERKLTAIEGLCRARTGGSGLASEILRIIQDPRDVRDQS